jgi:type II secretory pathway predicted ATPase ExeA
MAQEIEKQTNQPLKIAPEVFDKQIWSATTKKLCHIQAEIEALNDLWLELFASVAVEPEGSPNEARPLNDEESAALRKLEEKSQILNEEEAAAP